MAFWKKLLKKAIPGLLALSLCLPLLPVTTAAEEGTQTDLTRINPNQKGSITVTKYASARESENPGDATGTSGDAAGISADNYRRLNGAVFKLFRVATAEQVVEYYNGTNATAYNIANFVYSADGTATYDGVSATLVDTKTTGGTDTKGDPVGQCTFPSLEVGIYALVEVSAPTQITTPLAEPSLISIPMVNTATSTNHDNAEWMYDVYVYPKNHATATVDLTVYEKDDTTLLPGVKFELYKDGVSTGTISITGQNGQIKLEGLTAGQYSLVETGAPEGHIVNKNPLYFKVNANNTITWNTDTEGDFDNKNSNVISHEETTDPAHLTVKVRSEKPFLNMKVLDNGTTNAWKQDTQYAIGEEFPCKLELYVPKNVDELNNFTIQVAADAGLTFADSITISNGTTTLSTGFTRTKTANGFALTFDTSDENVLRAIQGQTLTITNNAYLNGGAKIADKGNDATASLEYSKEIDGTNGSYTLKDSIRVFTYDFEITKYKDSVDEANKLKGVEFQLLKGSSTGPAINLCKTGDGAYRPVVADDPSNQCGTTIVTGNDGKLHVYGLEKGDYYLKETKTVSGYNLLSAPFHMDLNIVETTTWTEGTAFADSTFTANAYGETGYKLGDKAITDTETKQTSDIITKKGFTLPKTGSMGYLLFCTVGIVLIGGGAMLLFGGRKKKIR